MDRDGQGPAFHGCVGNGQTFAFQDEGDVAGLTLVTPLFPTE